MNGTRSADAALRRLLHGRPRADDRRLAGAVAGRTVLVTGASSGVGRQVARRLATAGARVLVTARSAGRLEILVREIAAEGGSAAAFPADLTDPAAVAALAAWVEDEQGGVDALVNNAGHSLWRSFALTEFRPTDSVRMTEVNHLGPLRLTLALLPGMRARGGGRIVGVCSIAALLPTLPRMAAYVAAKSAFDTWLRGLATEVRGDGVRVVSVYLGVTRTRMTSATPWLRRVRPLSATDAAGLVCDALVYRRTSIGPWWRRGVQALGPFLRGSTEALLARWYARTADTPAARLVSRGTDRPVTAAAATRRPASGRAAEGR
ncbi:SDR family NAD(P)-dependent oxidoreductase [Streptomyces sp. TR06-5]|uniref:SDR family NAD(P)-dependent oxidoreductase n=1 Tax=unclassified Streptomyces TaxID=2593676 RepID=UPI0039A2A3F7